MAPVSIFNVPASQPVSLKAAANLWCGAEYFVEFLRTSHTQWLQQNLVSLVSYFCICVSVCFCICHVCVYLLCTLLVTWWSQQASGQEVLARQSPRWKDKEQKGEVTRWQIGEWLNWPFLSGEKVSKTSHGRFDCTKHFCLSTFKGLQFQVSYG